MMQSHKLLRLHSKYFWLLNEYLPDATVKKFEDQLEAELLVEWREKEGKLVANSISCNNPKLMDLKPIDCQWSCWEEVEKKGR